MTEIGHWKMFEYKNAWMSQVCWTGLYKLVCRLAYHTDSWLIYRSMNSLLGRQTNWQTEEALFGVVWRRSLFVFWFHSLLPVSQTWWPCISQTTLSSGHRPGNRQRQDWHTYHIVTHIMNKIMVDTLDQSDCYWTWQRHGWIWWVKPWPANASCWWPARRSWPDRKLAKQQWLSKSC